jgi:hypothetical protein
MILDQHASLTTFLRLIVILILIIQACMDFSWMLVIAAVVLAVSMALDRNDRFFDPPSGP